MNTSVEFQAPPLIDEPWRRLPWLAPLSILLWMVFLCGFSLLLRRSAPPPELKPISAQFVEVPVGSLHESTAPSAPAQPPPQEKPVPREIPLPKPVKKLAPRKEKEKPAPPQPAETNNPPSAQESSSGAATSSGAPPAGANTGLRGGSDHEGARAIYAPVPKIPDDLREEVFQAEAVARFNVSYDGTVTVSLVKPTATPRLNQIVLDTLKQWRFAPAVRGGVPIDSVFEVRIPITVE